MRQNVERVRNFGTTGARQPRRPWIGRAMLKAGVANVRSVVMTRFEFNVAYCVAFDIFHQRRRPWLMLS